MKLAMNARSKKTTIKSKVRRAEDILLTNGSGTSFGPVISNDSTVGTSLQGKVTDEVKFGLGVGAESEYDYYMVRHNSGFHSFNEVSKFINIHFPCAHLLMATTQRTPNFLTLMMWWIRFLHPAYITIEMKIHENSIHSQKNLSSITKNIS